MLRSKLFAVLAAGLLFAGTGSANRAAAADLDYEGEIDIYSGLPVSDAAADAAQQTVSVSDGVTYDRSAHMFSYMIPDQSGVIQSSVADGMITTESVSIVLPSGFSADLYRNGDKTEDLDYTAINQIGSYTLVVTGPEAQYQLLSFQIVAEKTGAVNVFEMPAGFQLTKVVLNGEPQRVAMTNSVDMATEGSYQITYRCAAIGIDYNLNITVDHTPPQVVLNGIGADGYARNPVSISGISAVDSAVLTRDDNKIKMPHGNTIKSPGKYKLIVTDDAGNVFSKEFTILFYLNMQGLIFTLLAVGVAAAVGIYMYISNKRLKVR